MRPGATCTLGFTDVVDKQGLALCAATAGGDCIPGDTSAISFGVEAFTLAATEPRDGATEVPLTTDGSEDAAITIRLNSELAPASVRGAILVEAAGAALTEAAMAEGGAATIRITVPGGFRAGTAYTLTIVGGAGGIRNRFDDALAEDQVVHWTTSAEEDDR